jgi:signal peptidase II
LRTFSCSTSGTFEWYVFNLADVWIVAGVSGLVLAWATERPEIATER